ncbi:hypothetical protein FG386_002766 [Cryptosporidium ryanae]|uniref:uncharacterized protein n=1 Tax=Cryptosporidium ryanae TaxID=515981 RepID=UPI00351A0AF1|nr:hypothetical protein FG386_002766 [Cryptosporidium ryanae]
MALDLIKSLNRIKESYELVEKTENEEQGITESSDTQTQETRNSKLKTCIEQYKESLDLVTDATIILSQCLQNELNCFDDIKKHLEELSVRNKDESQGENHNNE